MKERITYIDIAKGIGILLVYAGHCELGNGDAHRLFGWIYSFHMPLFFFISGLLFTDTYVPPKSFYRRKIASLIVPYIVFSVIHYLLFKLFHIRVSLGFVLYGWGRNALWFIPVLFLVNAAHYHIVWGEWWTKTPALLALVLLLIWKSNTNGWLPYCVSELPWFYMCFISGFITKKAIFKIEMIKFCWIWGVLGFVLLTILLFGIVYPYNHNYLHQDNDVMCWTMKYGLGILGALSTLCLSMSLSSIKMLRVTLSWLGKNSLVILCTHQLFYKILQTINYQPIVRGGYNHLIIWILMLMIVRWYNKGIMPMIKRIHNI